MATHWLHQFPMVGLQENSEFWTKLTCFLRQVRSSVSTLSSMLSHPFAAGIYHLPHICHGQPRILTQQGPKFSNLPDHQRVSVALPERWYLILHLSDLGPGHVPPEALIQLQSFCVLSLLHQSHCWELFLSEACLLLPAQESRDK